MKEGYKEARKELNRSYGKLDKFIKEHLPKGKHKEFYGLLNEVIDNEVEVGKFANW